MYWININNPKRRLRDASDLFFISRNYLDAGNLELLFDEAIDTVDQDDYDHSLASARLPSRDISKITIPSTKETLIKILQREADTQEGHRITVDVLKNKAYNYFHQELREKVVQIE